MSKPLIVAILVAAFCGIASAQMWRALRDERAQTAQLRARVQELEQQSLPLRRARTQPMPQTPVDDSDAATPTTSTVQVSQRQTTAPGARLAVTSAMPGNADADMRRRMQQDVEQQRRMLQDPEYRALMREQQKFGMQRMFGDLEFMLGLSHEEADKIRDLIAEQQLRGMEQRQAVPFENGRPDDATISEQQRVYQEMQRKNEAELRAALGAKYPEWQKYQQSGPARGQVMRLREALALTDEPLRQDQFKPLVDAIMQEQQQLASQTNGSFRPWLGASSGQPSVQDQVRMQEEWLERRAQSQQRIRDAATNLLTPAQLARLEQQHEMERRSMELNLRTMRARAAEAEARGENSMQPPAVGVPNTTLIVN